MNQVRKLDGILDVQDRHVVAYQVPDALIGIELDSKTAHITGGIFRATLTGHRRKPDKKGVILPASLNGAALVNSVSGA